MARRSWFIFATMLAACGAVPASLRDRAGRPPQQPFGVETTITDLRRALDEGRISSRTLVEHSLARIAKYDHDLHAVISVNPRALLDADARDRERVEGRARGPLHGIPIALKDNIHTTDMPATGGTLAFAGFIPPYEATVVRHLRDAGAVIVAKTQMTELANWVTVGMPTNYNSLNGYGFNPYDPRRDPRPIADDGRPALPTGGSSSGTGTAAGFWAGNIGTETSGSILSPTNNNMLAGIKPTVGRVSRYGIIPITTDQDTAGPMARSVTDVAIMFGAMEGATPDPNDPATSTCAPPPARDYTRFLDQGALRGARIGVPRAFFYNRVVTPGSNEGLGGLEEDERAAMEEAIAILRRQGAVVVDPADIPSVVDADPQKNILRWNECAGVGNRRGRDAGCSTVLKYGMKRDFNAWLTSLGPSAPVKTLTELRAWNVTHRDAGTLKYGQENLDISDEMDVVRDRERYESDRKRDLFLAGEHGIDEVMKAERLDALLFPGSSGAALSARPGYPTVMVPFALVANTPSPPFPAGFNARPAPMGVSFAGAACSEGKLIGLAYAFERATNRRVPPPGFP